MNLGEFQATAALRWGRSVWGSEFEPQNPDAYFSRLAEAGYSFVEVACPDSPSQAACWKAAAERVGLGIVAQIHSTGNTPEEHVESLRKQLRHSVGMAPELVNAHSGRDHFTSIENIGILRHTLDFARTLGLEIVHETHRSRATFSAPSTARLVTEIPDLRLCADFSHWCCVHESFLDDQAPAVTAALDRADYLHLRVGHTQSPQVPDPGAPEWQNAVNRHMAWWRAKIKSMNKGESIRVAPEFGPFPYGQFSDSSEDLWLLNESMRRLFLLLL